MKGTVRPKKKKKAGRIESENKELSGEFMECNTVEEAIKTEIDTRTE